MERRRGTSDAPTRWEEEEEATREERVLQDVEMRRRDRERRELIEREFEERTERRHSREERPYVFVGEERSHTRAERTKRAAEIAEDDTPEPRERRQQPADDQDIYSHIPYVPPPPQAEPQVPEDDASRDSDGSFKYRRRRVSGMRHFPPYAPAVGFVNLLDHQGRSYVFPLDKCGSKEATEPLWKEIYTHVNSDLLDDITKGKYRVEDLYGATILPSAWDAVIRSQSSIRIAFDKNPEYARRRRVFISGDSDSSTTSRHSSNQPPEPEGVDEDSTESVSEMSNTEAPPAIIVIQDQGRKAVAPVDSENNKLSFQVKTAKKQKPVQPKREPESHETSSEALDASKGANIGKFETMKITRAMHVEDQGRNLLKIYTISGPENPQLLRAVRMTWYHLPLPQLDFGRFTNLCLNIPPLSPRLRTLTHKLLAKLWKEKVNHFLGGMFVEPGTVLRADEIEQPDPQSVIFSCVPYFSLQPAAKKCPSGSESTLFPPRTLMQTYYPYESVRDRDKEQSYKRFSDTSVDSIIHVPNLWIMNIGSNVIVTCGHTSISEETVKSIDVVPEDIKQLGSHDVANNTLRKVRVIDWQGREFIFSISACRTYFQLEANLRELRYISGKREGDDKIRLQHRTPDGSKDIMPGDWISLIKRNDLVSITLAMIEDQKDEENARLASSSPHQISGSSSLIAPPFFHWPQSTSSGPASDEKKVQSMGTSDTQQTLSVLEQADKIMTTEFSTRSYGKVANAFKSTAYYKSLPEMTFQDISADFAELKLGSKREQQTGSVLSFHQNAINDQCDRISEQATGFFGIVRVTLELFVSNLDQSRILRKGWGAMKQLHDTVTAMTTRGSLEPDPNEYSDPKWRHPDMMERTWYIRTSAEPNHLAVPETNAQLNKVIKRCKRCSMFRSYDTPEAALKHLRKHATKAAGLDKPVAVVTGGVSASLDKEQPSQSPPPDSVLKDWVLNSEQFRREETNGGALATLTKAHEIAEELFLEASELAEGVLNEDGSISGLYKMPREMVRAFRDTIVFFMATERAVHANAEALRDEALINAMYKPSDGYRSEYGSEKSTEEGAVKDFGDDTRRSLRRTRFKLCVMVRPEPPLNLFKHMSLGPEYVCAWLMRRLLVKPLNRPETGAETETWNRRSLRISEQPQQQTQENVGDLYRGYISNLQFQVNSRASKRLLRDINLVQEELQALMSVNTRQINLIQNYINVLDDNSYEQENPTRSSMFPHERTLLETCLYNLQLARDDYKDLIRLCRPLSDRTKQILEINEEDHGKAIMIFTVVTVIFLPLSFATSYFGMNTADIRDMNQTQSLFWSVAIPLTILTVGGCMLIGYNGDDLRDAISSVIRTLTGRKKESPDAGGIGVSHRKPPPNLQLDMNSTHELANIDEAEFANPRPDEYEAMIDEEWSRPAAKHASRWKTIQDTKYEWDDVEYEEDIKRETQKERRYDHYKTEPITRHVQRVTTSRIRMEPMEYEAGYTGGWESDEAWYDMGDKSKWKHNTRRRRTEDKKSYRY